MKAFSLTLLIFLAGLAILPATPINIEQEKLSIEIPTTWTSSNTEGTLFSSFDAQNRSSMELFALPNSNEIGFDQPSFLDGIRRGMANKAASQGASSEISHEGPLNIHGVPFYLFRGVIKSPKSDPTYFRSYVTLANGKIYMLSLKTLDTHADFLLENIANSFTFQTPPLLPDPSKRPKDPVDRLGLMIGEIVGVVLVLFIINRLFPNHPFFRRFRPKPKP